jgi:colanic acid/amylovoran biosynthesis protein
MDILNRCDIVLSLRMHFNVLASTLYVPSVSFIATNSPRTPGILKMIGMEKYICNIIHDDVGEIMKVISDVWVNQNQIRNVLQNRIPIIKEKALNNGKLIEEIIEGL